jgi:hypothetical protein
MIFVFLTIYGGVYYLQVYMSSPPSKSGLLINFGPYFIIHLALVHLAVVTVVITIVTVTVIGIGEIEVIVIDVTEIVILIVTVTVIGVIAVTEIVIGIGVIRTRIESVVQPPAHLPLGLIKRIKMINNALNQ